MQIQISSSIFQTNLPEIDSENVDRVKAVLTHEIKDATHILVLIGKYANKKHLDSDLIDDTN